MFKKIEQEDFKIFMELALEFYRSSATSGYISDVAIQNTFLNIVGDNPLIKGYLIIIEGEVAGFFTIAFTFQTQYGKKVLLFEDLYLRPNFQGLSIGTKVFNYLEESYKEEVGAIRLEVSKVNKRAIDLYQRLGYQKSEYKHMVKEL